MNISRRGRLAALAFCAMPLLSQADILVGSSEVLMSPPPVAGFHSMEARIANQYGEVYNATSFGESLVWQCSGCPDGGYSVELRTAVDTGRSDESEEAKPILVVASVEHARFTVQRGMLRPDAETVGDESAGREEPSLLLRLFAGVLERLVPAAAAQDLTATSGTPGVYFVDNTDSFNDNDFTFRCQGGFAGATETNHFCNLIDFENNSNVMLFIDSLPGVVEFGIGTNMPTQALHLATPQTPNILLDSAGTDLLFGGSDDITFRFTANNAGPPGPILTLENDLNATTGAYPGVGIWEESPTASLHVGSHDGVNAKLTVQNTATPTGDEVVMLNLVNPGSNIVSFVMDTGASAWKIANNPGAGELRIRKTDAPGKPTLALRGAGDVYIKRRSIAVNHINTSTRKAKTDFAPVDDRDVLEKLAALPITTWRYRAEATDGDQVHIGPVAEDFQATFGLSDGRHISTVDATGVAFSAIKGLNRTVEDLEQEIAVLKRELQARDAQLGEVLERMAALEAGLARGGLVAVLESP